MTWRYRVARELVYLDSGRYLSQLPYQMLLTAGALRLLWPKLTLWEIGGLSVLAIPSLIVLGRVYRRWGWQQELNSVPTLEGMGWMSYVFLVWWVRLLEAHAIPLDGIPDPEHLPEDLRRLLAHGRHG